MKEMEINAKFNALIDQRNVAMNQVVNLLAEVVLLKAQLEAAQAPVAVHAEVVTEEATHG